MNPNLLHEEMLQAMSAKDRYCDKIEAENTNLRELNAGMLSAMKLARDYIEDGEIDYALEALEITITALSGPSQSGGQGMDYGLDD